MTETDRAAQDVLVRTPGLSPEELAAVLTVVRAAIDEELAEGEGVPQAAPDRGARRWRHALREVECRPREWR